jgi:hypothetical protein
MDIERIHDKLDTLIDKQSEMNAILAVQAEQLRIHILRTDQLEALAQDYREEMLDKVEPIEEHVQMLKGAGKAMAIVGTVVGLVLAALKLFFGR